MDSVLRMSARETIIGYLEERLARCTGGDLLRFSVAQISEDTDVKQPNVKHHVGPATTVDRDTAPEKRDAAFAEIVDRMAKATTRIMTQNAEQYQIAARATREADSANWLRVQLTEAIGADLEDFSSQASAATDRVYFLALALADSNPGIRKILQDQRARSREIHAGLYDGFREVLCREWLPGFDAGRAERVIGTYLEGVTTRRRLSDESSDGAAPETENDEAAETVATLFYAMTRPQYQDADTRDVFERLFTDSKRVA